MQWNARNQLRQEPGNKNRALWIILPFPKKNINFGGGGIFIEMETSILICSVSCLHRTFNSGR